MAAAGFWTDERVETLKAGWAAGLFAQQIAEQIGRRCTRNMVIGKAHRLNLPPHSAVEMARLWSQQNSCAERTKRAWAKKRTRAA